MIFNYRCHSRIKLDEANKICNLLTGHNHDPVEEQDYCGNEFQIHNFMMVF